MKKISKERVDETLAQFTTLTPQQASEMHGTPGAQLVDVHDVQELEQEGVIPGAYHAPRGLLEFWASEVAPQMMPADKDHVLFASSDWRPAQSAQKLVDLRLTDAS
jgi:rhodanese-related sulfurtransferase